jgi:hypothetical protein
MRALSRLAPLLACLLAASCIPLRQYHTQPPDPAPPKIPPSDVACFPKADDCSTAFLENRPEYLLGFVEFDDLGWSWDRAQQEIVLSTLEAEVDRGDALMVVFAHGWKHNASTCDNNVTCFREVLAKLYETEVALAGDTGTPRRIIGVYVGWRGDSSHGKLLKQTTFYGRKSTAHKVGSGAVTELFVRLKQIRERRHREHPGSATRLVIVGHSFGGALVYSATSQLIMERLALAASSPEDPEVRGFGDLVVLVNPAFEAARFEPLHAAVEAGTYPPDQRPVFIVVTSQGDQATGRAFPLGRWLPAKFDDYRNDGLGAEQKKANVKAVGHFPPYRTHFLEPNDHTPEPQKRNDALAANCGCPYSFEAPAMTHEAETAVMERLREHSWESDAELDFPLSTLKLEKGAPNAPIYVISTDPQIIRSHSDIYQAAFVDFLRYLIMMAGEPVDYGG